MNLLKKRNIEFFSFDEIIDAIVLSVSAVTLSSFLTNNFASVDGKIRRCPREVDEIFQDFTPGVFKRTYRMSKQSFWKLYYLLKNNDIEEINVFKRTRSGEIKLSSRLSIDIRWFAGGSQYDICQIHGVSYYEVMNSVWIIVDLVNLCDSIKIKFPCTHSEQNTVAQGLKKKSWVGFDNCVGYVDGMLIWIAKPSIKAMIECNIGAGNFFCGRKKNLV